AHQADDLERRRRAGVQPEPDVPPDRILVAEEPLREALVDDRVAVSVAAPVALIRVGRPRRGALVAPVELASPQDRNPHRLEVAGADRIAVGISLLARLRVVPPDGHRAAPLVALEQADAGERHTLYARLRADPLHERLVERRNPLRRIAADRRRDVERDHALGPDAEIEQPQILERADEQ